MGAEDKWGMTTNTHRINFWDDKNILKLAKVVVTKFFEYTKNHWIVHFKWANGMWIVYVDDISMILFFNKGEKYSLHQ